MGTSCGSPIDDGCANPDTCDAAGACQSNDEIDGAACSDCPAGASFCAGCQAAVCQNLPCGSNVCLFDTHCRPVATNGLCNDVPNDCLGSLCVGETAPGPNDAGISASENLESWQSSDDETTNGGQRWYCNVTQAVGAAGVLTDWDLFVDNGGANGEVAQFAVIRCSGGGGGAGPALSGCVRVGIGPAETINGDGMHSFSLSGSTQLDAATPSALGIVVEAGDWICADSNAYDIGVDCNGAAAAGGCPGPDFNTQQLANVDVVGEPFALQDSNSDGTLMIRASGFDDTGTAGACSDTEQLPAGANCSSEPTCNPDACDAGGTCVDNANVADTTLCNNNGGDTCCVGACIVGPSGAGTCQ
jgi:hypothetical protein